MYIDRIPASRFTLKKFRKSKTRHKKYDAIIVDIKTRNRKYPILTIGSNGKHYKHTVGQVKTLIGGDKIINRNANLDKILND